jgi:hypothetical protein
MKGWRREEGHERVYEVDNMLLSLCRYVDSLSDSKNSCLAAGGGVLSRENQSAEVRFRCLGLVFRYRMM